jgi:hypothetical protein
MPKENIEGTSRYKDSRLEIGWSRQGSNTVEVALNHEVNSPEERFATWVNLDRDGVNRAIAALRRARDQVFGKDR